MNKNELNAYDLRRWTVNLRVGELKLRFNQKSLPIEVIVQQLDSNKVRQQTVHIIKVPPPPNFLCKEILFKLLTFRYAITCKCEESSPRKSLPVLYTPSVGPSRLRILSPLIHKEGHWFELLHERCTEPAPPPFDDFQEGLRAVSRIHSSYQDEPWHHVISLTTRI